MLYVAPDKLADLRRVGGLLCEATLRGFDFLR